MYGAGGGGSGYIPAGGTMYMGVSKTPNTAATSATGYTAGIAIGGSNGSVGGNGRLILTFTPA